MGSVDRSVLFPDCLGDGDHDQSQAVECSEKHRADMMLLSKRLPRKRLVAGRHRNSSF
jgi:hypothetical protein